MVDEKNGRIASVLCISYQSLTEEGGHKRGIDWAA